MTRVSPSAGVSGARRGRPVDHAARAERTRLIIEAACRVFAREGFHGAGTAEICREAGISHANLFQYFPTKEDLIVAIVETDRAGDKEVLAPLFEEPSLVAGFRATIDAIRQRLVEMPDYPKLRAEVLAEAVRNRRVADVMARCEATFTAVIAGAIARGQAQGEIRRDLPAALVARQILCLFDGMLVRQPAVAPLAPIPLDDLADFLMCTLLLQPAPAAPEPGAA